MATMMALRSATPARLNAASLFGGKGADQRRLWQCVALCGEFRRYVGVSPSVYRARLKQYRIQGLWGRIYKTLLYALTHAPLLLPFSLEPARVVV